jgi:hypothetical protein
MHGCHVLITGRHLSAAGRHREEKGAEPGEEGEGAALGGRIVWGGVAVG